MWAESLPSQHYHVSFRQPCGPSLQAQPNPSVIRFSIWHFEAIGGGRNKPQKQKVIRAAIPGMDFQQWPECPGIAMSIGRMVFGKEVVQQFAQLPAGIKKLIPKDVRTMIKQSATHNSGTVFDFVEVCAGSARMTFTARQNGLAACAYDVKYDADGQDLSTNAGWANLLCLLMSIRPGGFAWFSPQCSNFVPLCMSVTKRSLKNIYGDPRPVLR
jgi:hypothetical protein